MQKRRHRISDQTLALIPSRPIKVGLLAAPEARVLDLAGPWEAFSRANEVVAELQSASESAYQLELAAIDGPRSAVCFGGLSISVTGDFRSLDSDLDALLVGGGRATWEIPKNEKFLGRLRQTSGKLQVHGTRLYAQKKQTRTSVCKALGACENLYRDFKMESQVKVNRNGFA